MRVVLALDTLVEVLRFTVSLGCQRNTGVEVLLLELERLQAKSCLLFAYVAGGLAELVLATLVAKLKIKTEVNASLPRSALRPHSSTADTRPRA